MRKTIKFIGLMALAVLGMRAGATEVPEAMILHHRDGSVTATAFAAFRHLKFSGENMLLVGQNEPASFRLSDIANITFGALPEEVAKIKVTFEATGNGSGNIAAFAVKNGVRTQPLAGGVEVPAGDTVLFCATPETGSKIKGWKMNDDYEETSVAERMVRLDEELHGEELHVEVEFVKETGVEDAEAVSSVRVYVHNREIGVECGDGIERVDIIDMGGRLLGSEVFGRSNHVLMNAGRIRTGVYMLKIRTPEREETRKVFIR